MLDFKDFTQVMGIIQMSSSQDEQLTHLHKMYEGYLSYTKEQRKQVEEDLLKKILPVTMRLNKLQEESKNAK